METRVETCRRQHRGAFKWAHFAGFVSAVIAYAALVLAKLADYPPVRMTWGTVAVFPLVVYAIVFAIMLWNFGRAMKRSRVLDAVVDQQSFVSVRAQS
jgi:energy-converting hydrogenase Eha subunit A